MFFHTLSAKRFRFLLLMAVGSLLVEISPSWAQGVSALKINEVLVENVSNSIDSYGKRSPWIEIYNPTAATVDIGGCYLTNDITNFRKYPIPKGDVLTRIQPRQHILFYADAHPGRGTFHTSFELSGGKDNFIALIGSDGATIIDSVTVPANLPMDASYARFPDGADLKTHSCAWRINTTKITPSSNNTIEDPNKKLQELKTKDPYGVAITIVAMLVVFVGLLLLFLAFKYISLLTIYMSGRRMKRSKPDKDYKGHASGIIRGEVSAAIALAIHEATSEIHDEEYDILTLREQKRRYSPWSSKIYNLRQPLNRRPSR